ncbi:glycine betaine ABC transporter substrate-binding protein [Salipaludibacillus sp. CF4.18]|uniref:glycine betaine ABC transporter substrate-binding protein n=1 Tax=Salipaludibacillus sp. CF4.18 TaxID=3373081 RepID=UPI003EE607C4
MKKIINVLISTAVVTAIAGCGAEDDNAGEITNSNANQGAVGEGETISFGVTPWTSTIPPTEVASLILQEMGYEVEQTDADVGSIFVGLSRGDLDVFMDSWMPMHENYLEEYSDSVSDTAVSYPEAETGWTVPAYMEDINSVEDIVGNEDLFNNEMYGIEEGASATKESNELIEAYDLDMTQVASSEGGMLAEAQRKMSTESPVVFYGWRPHTMFNQFDLKIISNEKGFFETSSVHVVTSNDLKERAPEAYEFFSNWSISIDDVEEMIVEIEEGGRDAEEVAQEWIDNNREQVDEMMGQ